MTASSRPAQSSAWASCPCPESQASARPKTRAGPIPGVQAGNCHWSETLQYRPRYWLCLCLLRASRRCAVGAPCRARRSFGRIRCAPWTNPPEVPEAQARRRSFCTTSRPRATPSSTVLSKDADLLERPVGLHQMAVASELQRTKMPVNRADRFLPPGALPIESAALDAGYPFVWPGLLSDDATSGNAMHVKKRLVMAARGQRTREGAH
jgi:hypothetical protein